MKINYKVCEENMELITADISNKNMWEELTKDPKTHRVSERLFQTLPFSQNVTFTKCDFNKMWL